MTIPPPAPKATVPVALPGLPWSTGLRAVAMAAVLVYHAFLTAVPNNPSPIERPIVLVLAASARLAVLAFIMLSGYLLGRHWVGEFSRSGLGSRFGIWMARRSMRIVPTYLVAAIAVVVAMLFFGFDEPRGTHWDSGLPFTWWRTFTMLTLTTDIFNQVPLSHQLWTVPLEYHLYLLAPLVVLARTRLAITGAAALAVLAAGFLNPDFGAPWFLAAFMVSFWVGVRRRANHQNGEPWRSPDLVVPLLLPTMAALPVFLWSGIADSPRNYLLVEVVFSLVFLPLILQLDLRGSQGMIVRILENRTVLALGTWSYSIYLVHGLVIEALWRVLFDDRGLGTWQEIGGILLLSSILSVAVGWVLFVLVESPTERRARRIRVAPKVPEPIREGA